MIGGYPDLLTNAIKGVPLLLAEGTGGQVLQGIQHHGERLKQRKAELEAGLIHVEDCSYVARPNERN